MVVLYTLLSIFYKLFMRIFIRYFIYINEISSYDVRNYFLGVSFLIYSCFVLLNTKHYAYIIQFCYDSSFFFFIFRCLHLINILCYSYHFHYSYTHQQDFNNCEYKTLKLLTSDHTAMAIVGKKL